MPEEPRHDVTVIPFIIIDDLRDRKGFGFMEPPRERRCSNWCRRNRRRSTGRPRAVAGGPSSGTQSMSANRGSGRWLIVGRMIPRCIPSMVSASSMAAAAPRVWPIWDLLEEIGIFSRCSSEDRSQTVDLDLVPLRRGGAVGVYVLDIRGRHPRVVDRLPDPPDDRFGVRLGEMVGVRGPADPHRPRRAA